MDEELNIKDNADLIVKYLKKYQNLNLIINDKGDEQLALLINNIKNF